MPKDRRRDPRAPLIFHTGSSDPARVALVSMELSFFSWGQIKFRDTIRLWLC